VARFRAGTFMRINAVLKEGEYRTDLVREAVELLLRARGAPAARDRPRARAPPTPQREARVPVELEPLLVDQGHFGRALAAAAASGKERPPALIADVRPGTKYPTRWTPPVGAQGGHSARV